MEFHEGMSVARARLMMPDATLNMSDEEVLELVTSLENLAAAIVEAVQSDSEFRANIAYNRGEEVE